jgi:hypothetical protein
LFFSTIEIQTTLSHSMGSSSAVFRERGERGEGERGWVESERERKRETESQWRMRVDSYRGRERKGRAV